MWQLYLLGIVLLGLSLRSSDAQESLVNKLFEYKVEALKNTSDEVMQKRLNELGNEGWELVNVNEYGYFLKRSK